MRLSSRRQEKWDGVQVESMRVMCIYVLLGCLLFGLLINLFSMLFLPERVSVLGTSPALLVVWVSNFGSFTYVDTLKILQKWGPGCYFYGYASDEDLDSLEKLLESGEQVLALFCEFPSNPLLVSPDLKRIRRLADKYDFAVVIDETIGNFINIAVLDTAD